jgi:ubiquinol-cytochrome c reductase cytochrome b subunit
MKTSVLTWINKRFPLNALIKNHLTAYYVPKNLNIFYIFGALLLLIIANQFITGIWLTMFYVPTAKDAFDSIEWLMRDVNDGYILRYMHSTGASCVFVLLYCHIYRGLRYGSYQSPRELVWLLGLLLFFLLMIEAFFGYLLPWGQMSYWGAEVITSLIGAIPYIGDSILRFVRGDYAVSTVTLHRFFAFHVIALPISLIVLIYLHIKALHHVGSNNPDGITIPKQSPPHPDLIPFHPYYTSKDFFYGTLFFILFFYIVFFNPTFYGYFLEPDNFSKANPLVTPSHIAPLWYMTPFYAMLRAIPNKLLGILTMISALLILFALPWLDKSPVKSMRYKGALSNLFLMAFVVSFFTLGYVGMTPVTSIKQFIAQCMTLTYFSYFIFMPVYTRFETPKQLPMRIT